MLDHQDQEDRPEEIEVVPNSILSESLAEAFEHAVVIDDHAA